MLYIRKVYRLEEGKATLLYLRHCVIKYFNGLREGLKKTCTNLVSEIYSFESSLYDFRILLVFVSPFWGNFWVSEIFKNSFGMRICDLGWRGVYLVKCIHLRAPYMILGFW